MTVTIGIQTLLAPLLLMLVGLILAVLADSYIRKEHRRIMLIIAIRSVPAALSVRGIRHSVTNRRRASRHSPRKSTVRRRTRVRCAARSFPVQNVFIASVLCGFFQYIFF